MEIGEKCFESSVNLLNLFLRKRWGLIGPASNLLPSVLQKSTVSTSETKILLVAEFMNAKIEIIVNFSENL